jgi:hypothetical protein
MTLAAIDVDAPRRCDACQRERHDVRTRINLAAHPTLCGRCFEPRRPRPTMEQE